MKKYKEINLKKEAHIMASFLAITVLSVFAGFFVCKYFAHQDFIFYHQKIVNDPDKFPLLQEFAKNNFNVDVVMGDGETALMTIKPGYCHLDFYRGIMDRVFDETVKADEAIMMQGIMMHELGHCLDISRDYPASFRDHSVFTHSVAPVDASQVKNIQSFLKAGERDSTKLWREALADTFAVGYWRLAVPQDAERLASLLLKKRMRDKKYLGDKSHFTVCWIENAMKAAAPDSTKDLFVWADHLRSVSKCDL